MAMAIYGSWFWIKGRSSDRFVATPCGNIVFLFGRIPARHFGRASIFFTILSLYMAGSVVLQIVVYRPSREFIMNAFRHMRSDNPFIEAIDQRTKSDIIEKINREAQLSLVLFLRSYCTLSSQSAISAHLVDFDLDHFLISSSDGATEHVVPIQPPMRSYNGIKDRFTVMHMEAAFAARALSIGGDWDVTSVSERFRATYRHLRQPLTLRAAFETDKDTVPFQ